MSFIVYMYMYSFNNEIMVSTSMKKCSKLEGPLSMYPPAEDNYGTDACHVICLHTRPPIVVIATAEGKLHHCCVLEDQSKDSDEVSNGHIGFKCFNKTTCN